MSKTKHYNYGYGFTMYGYIYLIAPRPRVAGEHCGPGHLQPHVHGAGVVREGGLRPDAGPLPHGRPLQARGGPAQHRQVAEGETRL